MSESTIKAEVPKGEKRKRARKSDGEPNKRPYKAAPWTPQEDGALLVLRAQGTPNPKITELLNEVFKNNRTASGVSQHHPKLLGNNETMASH